MPRRLSRSNPPIHLSFQPGSHRLLATAELDIGLASPFATWWLHPVLGLSPTPAPLSQGLCPDFRLRRF
jgi:hypothetical protein